MRGKLIGWLAGLIPLPAQAQQLPSAVQVIEAFRAADQGPDALVKGFQALGFQVTTLDQAWPTGEPDPGDYRIVLDLWVDQQPYANALCLRAGPSTSAAIAALFPGDDDPFADAARQPYPAGIGRRIVCTYALWNPEPALTAFLGAASAWAGAQIGPLVPTDHPYFAQVNTAVDPDLRGSDRPWAIQLILINGGDEGSAALSVVTDYGNLVGSGPGQTVPDYAG
jgi:hypothetical protein